jgi:tryptophan synthase alpha subunit
MVKTANIISNIITCNDSGRLALAVYLIHGYPSLESSKRAFDLLQTHNTTIIECGLPVAFFCGSNMSDTIKDAHSVAS